MNKKTKIILFVIIIFFIIGMAAYPMIKKKVASEEHNIKTEKSDKTENSKGSKNSINVNAQILKYENLEDTFRTKGILIPDEVVDLSFETSGKIINIYFNEGSNIKKGTLLAKINDKPLQAELNILKTQVPLAEDRLFRQKALLQKDAVSQETYESVNTELQKLRADIELVRTKIAQTELRAPFDGIIGLRLVSNGAYASPTTIISRLTKISPIKIEFSTNEKQADKIKKGTNISFTSDNESIKYNADIYAVESSLDEQTLSLKARAIYQNPNGILKPGQSVNVEIRLAEINNTLVIPSLSTIAEMGKDIVYIYKDGKAHQISIKKGMRTASSVQILEGLKVGDTLLTTGVMQLREGMIVTLDKIN